MSDHNRKTGEPDATGRPDVQHPARVLKYADTTAPAVSVEVLKALWDRIVFDLGITKARWTRLSTSYIYEVAREEGRGTNVNLVEERSSLNKNFVTQAKMTWRSFCRAMQFVRARRFRIGITIEHASGRMTEHGIWVPVNPDLTLDPELDDEIAVPIEVDFTDNVSARPAGHRYHVPPPNLREFSGSYPSKSNPKGPGSTDNHS